MSQFKPGDTVRQRFSDLPMRVAKVREILPTKASEPPKFEVDCEWEQGGVKHRATFATPSELRLVPPPSTPE